MTYEAQEESLESGQPIELYEFFAGGVPFRFTNGETEQVRTGETYLAAGISRSNIKRSGPKFEAETEIRGSLEDETISGFLTQWAQISPEGHTTIKIYEKHLTDGAGEYRTNFIGEVESVRFDELQARLLCKTMGDITTREGPKDTWGGDCENQFGDSYCQVILTNFQKQLPLTTLGADGITLTFNTVGDGQNNGDFIGGMVKLQSRPFDFRFVVDHVGDVLTLQQPFADISPGDPCDIVQGCHHTVDDCLNRFDNLVEYGATPYTPRDNPFTTSLDNL